MESPSDIVVLQANKFTLENIIGQGSYAKVFRAIKLIDETRCIELACKVIDTSKAHIEYLTKFLPRELDILIRVNHPHIVHVTNIFQRRARYFIFMRFAENGDLFSYITNNGALSEGQSRLWLRQLICGLHYLHTLNIAHRDLKCENVLITANYNVKLTDFGFARNVQNGGPDGVLSETFCGSLLYAAPEVLRGTPYLPKLADIWSMGIILYAMLNKAMPFNESSAKTLYEKQVQRQWRFRTRVVYELSLECKELVTQMLDPEAQARPTAGNIFNGPWISMDPRLTKLTFMEESLLQKAGNEIRRKRGDNEDDTDIASPDTKTDGLKTLKDIDIRKISGDSGPLRQEQN